MSARGAVLLEVLVAVALVGLIASGALWSVSELSNGRHRATEREAEVQQASRLMTAASLWPVEDLDRHLGESRQGRFRLRITRVDAILYHVVVADDFGTRVLLETWLYRDRR